MTDQQINESISKMKNIKYFLFNISREKGIPGHINIKMMKNGLIFFIVQVLNLIKNLQIIRTKYTNIKPDLTELWQKNIFVFKN